MLDDGGVYVIETLILLIIVQDASLLLLLFPLLLIIMIRRTGLLTTTTKKRTSTGFPIAFRRDYHNQHDPSSTTAVLQWRYINGGGLVWFGLVGGM